MDEYIDIFSLNPNTSLAGKIRKFMIVIMATPKIFELKPTYILHFSISIYNSYPTDSFRIKEPANITGSLPSQVLDEILQI